MDAAIWGVVAAIVGVLAAAGTAVMLSLKLGDAKGTIADLRIALDDAKDETAKKDGDAQLACAELGDYRRRAQVELGALRAEIETMQDEPHLLDPASRRARWGRLLAKVDNATDSIGPGAATAVDLLPGLDGDKPAAGAAGSGAAGPGTGRPAA